MAGKVTGEGRFFVFETFSTGNTGWDFLFLLWVIQYILKVLCISIAYELVEYYQYVWGIYFSLTQRKTLCICKDKGVVKVKTW